MTDPRGVVVWGWLAAHAAAQGRRVSLADVCAVAVSSAELTGAWLAVARGSGPGFVLCVAGPAGGQLAELQLMLGEGPCHDVLASAAPVLAADLGDEEFSRRWPAFIPAARQLGVGAVFAFPLIVGAIRAGVVGRQRDRRRRGRGRYRPERAGSGPGAAPRRDRPGHRDADGATWRLGRGCVRTPPGLRLFSGPAPGGRGRRHRRPQAAAAPGPGSRRRPVTYPKASAMRPRRYC